MGYLVQRKTKSTKIRSYISAIKTILKEDKVELNENLSHINTLTRACKLMVDKVRTKLPIHKDVLRVILKHALIYFKDQPYLSVVYCTIFMTAYFSLFRIWELTHSNQAIKAVDVHIAENKPKLMFVLHSSKTHVEYSKPQIVKILGDRNYNKPRKYRNKDIIPLQLFSLLQQFIKL